MKHADLEEELFILDVAFNYWAFAAKEKLEERGALSERCSKIGCSNLPNFLTSEQGHWTQA